MIVFLLSSISVLVFSRIFLKLHTRTKIYSVSSAPFNKYTLVLGAGLENNGRPTDILADRVQTAVNLFKAKRTDILILSGSSNTKKISEPESMKALAVSFGLMESNLVLDFGGKTTFDSCLNLNNISDCDQITIVTQAFHLPRAIFLAEMVGYKAIGVPANIYCFSIYKNLFWSIREIFAFINNLIKILIYRFQHKVNIYNGK
jgi:SanA protein